MDGEDFDLRLFDEEKVIMIEAKIYCEIPDPVFSSNW